MAVPAHFNVIPGTVEVYFNFRFATASAADGLKANIKDILQRHGCDYDITWALGGKPFVTSRGPLVDALTAAVREVTGVTPARSTAGGTSDGRFIADVCGEIAEFGPVNATIHKLNERVALTDIAQLHDVYFATLENLLIERVSHV